MTIFANIVFVHISVSYWQTRSTKSILPRKVRNEIYEVKQDNCFENYIVFCFQEDAIQNDI